MTERAGIHQAPAWTAAEDALVRKGWLEAKLSCTEIAKRLRGRSPRQVDHRIDALKLPRTRIKHRKAPAGSAQPVARVDGNRNIIVPQARATTEPDSTTLGRLDALWRQYAGAGCQHFAGDRVGDFRRCGRPTAPLATYCDEHAACCVSTEQPVRKVRAA